MARGWAKGDHNPRAWRDGNRWRAEARPLDKQGVAHVVRVSRGTRAEAERAVLLKVEQVRSGGGVPKRRPQSPNAAAALKAWIEENPRGLTEQTLSQHIYLANKWLNPILDDLTVAEIDQDAIGHKLASNGATPSRIRKAYYLLKAAFGVEGTPPPKDKRRDARRDEAMLITQVKDTIDDDILRLLAKEPDKQARWALRLLGLRQGEVLGLRVKDIHLADEGEPVLNDDGDLVDVVYQDSAASYVRVEGQLTRHFSNASGKKGAYRSSETKTELSERSLPLPERVEQLVAAQVHRREQDGAKPEDLLFVNSRGNPVRQQDDNKQWHQLSKGQPWEGMRAHLLRAIAATKMRDNGATDAELMTMFGWSTSDMANLYDRRKDAGRLERIVAKTF